MDNNTFGFRVSVSFLFAICFAMACDTYRATHAPVSADLERRVKALEERAGR